MSNLVTPEELPLRLDPYRGPEDDPIRREGGWLASVALVLRPGMRSPEVLLIKRARLQTDPWSGQMALPGGRQDPGDPSLLHTARREAREEVALSLGRSGEMLGRLDVVAPMTPHLPPLTILPLVFSVPGDEEARVASPEVAEVVWTPIGRFLDPASRTTHRFRREETTLRFPAFDVGGRIVWGLTHRILEDFLSRIRQGPESEIR